MNIQDLVANPIYATEPAPGVSEKYQFIPTYKVIESFEKEGFEISHTSFKNVRSPKNIGYGSHIVRMRRPTEPVVGDVVPEVLIMNSHNRSKALRIGLGFFRFVCANGLITGGFVLDTERVKHIGDNMADRVLAYVDGHVKQAGEKIRLITEMEGLIMTQDDTDEFVAAAAKIVNPNIAWDYELAFANRQDDAGKDLWKLFNRVQENAMKGNFYMPSGDKMRKARPIKNIDRNVEVNAKLWNLAESYVR